MKKIIFIIFAVFIVLLMIELASATWWNSSFDKRVGVNLSDNQGIARVNAKAVKLVSYNGLKAVSFCIFYGL